MMTSLYEPPDAAGTGLTVAPDAGHCPFGASWQPVTLGELHAFARRVQARFEAGRACGESGERAGMLAEAEQWAQTAWHEQFHDHRYGDVGEQSAPPLAWKGYVEHDADSAWRRCAVAYLGQGVFLVHSCQPQPVPWHGPDALLDHFEVVAPCACGPNRYRSDPVARLADLAAVLDQILGDPPVCAGSCAASSCVRRDTAVGRSGLGR
jgi:hypothetical protein